MIIQRSLRHQPVRQFLQTLRSHNAVPSRTSRRGLHNVPLLTHGEAFKEGGIPPMMSKEGFEIAWIQKQAALVERLNELTERTAEENSSTKNILIKTSRRPEHASLFNHASMAHNNYFFFEGISPEPTKAPLGEAGDSLGRNLAEDFSSMESLKLEFLATGEAMFGPGFVWLVLQQQEPRTYGAGKFRIYTTYNAGTPYSEAHFRRQQHDMNNQATGLSLDEHHRQTTPQNRVGSFNTSAPHPKGSEHVALITPLLCVSTWEHAWLPTWGVNGKRQYLEAWWDHINWDKLRASFSRLTSRS